MASCARTLTAVFVGLLIVCTGATAAEPRLFDARSVWNQPLARDAAIAPDSRALVAELVRQRRFSTPWVNTTIYSTPVYTVGPDEARSAVYIDTPSALFSNDADAAEVGRQLADVPIPPGARPAAGHNHHMVVWQPSTDTMWELWNAYRVPDDPSPWRTDSIRGWHAAWGARIEAVSRHPGANPAPFGATASGLPLAGGLIRLSEWRGGRIPHALALGVHDIAAGRTVWPAARTDGRYGGRRGIPMGTRFRLDPRVNVDRLRLSPAGRIIARAAQRYGMVVRDHADRTFAFYGEDPSPTGANPYPSIFGGLRPDQALKGFPWHRLQVVAVRRRP
jgi:hypothetical protein